MKTQFQIRILTLGLLVGAFSSCTRVADKTPLEDASVTLPAPKQDKTLPIREDRSQVTEGGTVALNLAPSQFRTAEYFSMIDQLKSLALLNRDESLGALAKSLYHGFYSNEGNFTRTTFLRGPIPSAIIGQGEKPVLEEVQRLDAEMSDAVGKMTALLEDSARTYPWPKELPQLEQAVEVVDQYVAWLNAQVEQLEISGKMKAAFAMQLRLENDEGERKESEYKKLRTNLVTLVQGMNQARRLRPALTVLKRGLKDLSVKMKKQDAASLRQADELAGMLEDMESPQDALAILVTVWRMTPPKDRKETFKTMPPQLTKLFQEQEEKGKLDCLKYPHCPNIILGISKGVIFKHLKKYGLQKLRNDVDVSAGKSVVEKTRTQLVQALPELPITVRDKLKEQTDQILALFQKVRADFPGFARSRIEKWASVNFKQSLRGLETGEIQVAIAGRDRISVSPVRNASPVVSTGAKTIGASLALAHEFLPEEDATSMLSAMAEPIMKMLVVGGFRQANGHPYPNFLLPLDQPVERIFQLESLMKGTSVFAVPDRFQANADFKMDRVHAARNMGVGDQAELLKGFARQVLFHRDWEENHYNVTLGKIPLSAVIPPPEAPEDLLTSPFLAKDIVFSLAVANAGALLQNLVMDLSPAFLVLESGELLWGNRYKEIQGDKISAIAGIVPIVDGKRSGVLQTAEVARYALALDEFMGATEGLENSKAALLQTKTDDGRSTMLADILELRKKLRLVQMGFANFLVNLSIQKDGSVHGRFTVGTRVEKAAAPLRLEDQVLAVRALLATAKRLELPLFRQQALNIYYGMNHRFFDAKRQFYAAELDAKGAPAVPARIQDVVQALLMGEELSEFMPSDARAQWTKLARPWLRALGEI